MMICKETETVEFKKTTAELKEAVISIVAMLNKHGQESEGLEKGGQKGWSEKVVRN